MTESRLTSYYKRRLAAEFPELAAQVTAGELSFYAASVAAGIREATWTCPAPLDRAAAVLARRYADDIPALIDAITEADAANREPR